MERTNKSFIELIPDGWFKLYLDKMLEMNNEMPLAFHFLACAVAFGNGMGFRNWIRINRGVPVFPNLNAILFSPAGECRRGEGTKLAMKVAKLGGVRVLEGRLTPEGLLDELKDSEQEFGCGNLLLYIEELSTLLTKRDYQQHIIPLLTKLMLNTGGQVEERTRGGGKKTIEKVNLSCLFTTAPDWFLTSIPQEAYGGGMMSRLVPCYIEKREVRYVNINPAVAIEDDDKWFNEMGGLMRMVLEDFPPGEVKVATDAIGMFEKWYNEHESKDVPDSKLRPSKTRLPSNVIRMAMILACASHEREVSRERLKQAIDILEWTVPTLWDMYGYNEEVGSELGKYTSLVLQTLANDGGSMLHRDLLKKIYSRFKDKRQLQVHMEAMEEQGLVKRLVRSGYPDKHWPPVGWRVAK